MRRSTWKLLATSLLLGLVIGSAWLILKPGTSYALAGTGYFRGGGVSAADDGGDVLLGRPAAVPSSAYAGGNKEAFIAWMNGQVAHNSVANSQQAIGAAFIVNTMTGQGAHNLNVDDAMWNDFMNRVRNPSVQMYDTVDDPNNYGNGQISFYDARLNDDFFDTSGYNPVPATRPLLIFKDLATGTVYVIEIQCGNPVGGLSLLPYNPNTLPSGNVETFNCNGATGWMWDPDSPNTAITFRLYINGTLAGQNVANGGRPDGTFHGFGIGAFSSFPQFNPRAVNSISIHAVDAQTGQEITIGNGDFSVGPCVQANCGTSTFPSSMAVGDPQSFTVQFQLSYAWGPPYTTSDPAVRVTITDPNGAVAASSPAAGTNVPYNAGFPVAGTTLTAGPVTFTPTVAGTYKVNWSLVAGPNSPGTSITCGYGSPNGGAPNNGDASFLPYFSVKGGDITAGAGYGDGAACSTSAGTNAGIVSQNLGASGGYAGGGTTAGAWASGTITNFVSGMGLSGGAATQSGHAISFANTTPPANVSGSNYGGSFGGQYLSCLADYSGTLATASPAATTVSGNFTQGNVSSASTGVHNFKATGPIDINGLTIRQNQTINLYVTGDVRLTGDILYNYGALSEVPRFNLYVTGNIYIVGGVGELHGVYSAQKSGAGSGGNVYTCASAIGSTSESYAYCNRQLHVYGSMMAQSKLVLSRTYGNVVASGGVPAAPGELFEYSPELWLNNNGDFNGKIQSYSNLPPVL